MKTTLWIAILIIVGIASFKLGFTTGIYQFELYESPPKAYMAAMHLESIDNKRYNRIKIVQQNNLTHEIVKYGESLNYDKYFDYVMPWLLWPYNSHPMRDLIPSPSREEFIKKAINYRRTHPIDWPYDLSQYTDENKDTEWYKNLLRKKQYYDSAMQSIK